MSPRQQLTDRSYNAHYTPAPWLMRHDYRALVRLQISIEPTRHRRAGVQRIRVPVNESSLSNESVPEV